MDGFGGVGVDVDRGHLDIIDAFGPLAGMHAALDRAGAGMPCGLAARFPGATVAAVQAAVGRAAAGFPLLSQRLDWRDGRPVFVSACEAGAGPVSLQFAIEPNGGWWRWSVAEREGDAWLTAVWAHVGADGLSMLRFLQAVQAELTGDGPAPPVDGQVRPAPRPPRAGPWTAALIREHFRRHLRPRAAASSPCGASWRVSSADDRDRLLAQARAACGGVGPWLAAAGALALAQGRSGDLALNLPIARDRLDAVGGFGFGVGSLLMPVRLAPGATLDSLAPRIARRARRMAEIGWDGGLRRFLGDDPARHARFAAVRARGRPDPTLNVSWKGRVSGFGAARDAACFAAAPTAHLSAHADDQGLSLSLSAPWPRAAREAMLADVARRLGLAAGARTFDLADLVSPP